MSRKHKKVCVILSYIANLLILPSAITGCLLIYAFVSLLTSPIGITSPAIGLKICAIVSGIKKCISIIKRKRKISMIK